MGFYENKLDEYSQFKNPTQQQRQATQQAIINAREKKCESLQKGYNTLNNMSQFRTFDGFCRDVKSQQKTDLEVALADLNAIKKLDTDEFYRYLARQEFISLQAYAEEVDDKKAEAENHASVLDKVKGFFGIESHPSKNDLKTIESSEKTLRVLDSAVIEWGNLTADERESYLIGRFEVENKNTFDKQSFGEYITTTLSEEQFEDSPVQ